MHRFMACLALVLASAAATQCWGQLNSDNPSVVLVESVSSMPNPYQPWEPLPEQSIEAAGFVVDEHRVVTASQVARDAITLTVMSAKTGDPVPATVAFVDERLGLALLEIQDEAFKQEHAPLQLADHLPDDGADAEVFTYSRSRRSTVAHSAEVSGMEFGSVYLSIQGLKIELSPPLPEPQRGSPVVVDGACVGMIIEAADKAFALSSIEIARFMVDASDGSIEGKPYLDVEVAQSRNPHRRSFLQMDEAMTGLTVLEASEASGLLPWDVITQIAGIDIDNSGRLTLDGRTWPWQFAIEHFADTDNTIELQIFRGGEALELDAHLTTASRWVLGRPHHWKPEYFIHGPFVFTGAAYPHTRLVDDDRWHRSLSHRVNPLLSRREDRPRFLGEELVILASQPFAHPIMWGYETVGATFHLEAVNGVPVRNLRHAHTLITQCRDEFIELQFSDERMDNRVVFRTEALWDATDEILDAHRIERDESWND